MKTSILALALAATLPLSAQASELKYNYVELGYNQTNTSGLSLHGYDFKGSAGFGDNFFGTASYQHGSDNGLDLNETTVGLGFRNAVSDKADFNASVSYVRDNVDLGGLGSNSENGYRVAAGMRGLLTDKFEGNFNVNYTDVNNFGNGVGAGIGALVHLNDTWGISTGYDYSKRDSGHLNTWNLGVRASF